MHVQPTILIVLKIFMKFIVFLEFLYSELVETSPLQALIYLVQFANGYS